MAKDTRGSSAHTPAGESEARQPFSALEENFFQEFDGPPADLPAESTLAPPPPEALDYQGDGPEDYSGEVLAADAVAPLDTTGPVSLAVPPQQDSPTSPSGVGSTVVAPANHDMDDSFAGNYGEHIEVGGAGREHGVASDEIPEAAALMQLSSQDNPETVEVADAGDGDEDGATGEDDEEGGEEASADEVAPPLDDTADMPTTSFLDETVVLAARSTTQEDVPPARVVLDETAELPLDTSSVGPAVEVSPVEKDTSTSPPVADEVSTDPGPDVAVDSLPEVYPAELERDLDQLPAAADVLPEVAEDLPEPEVDGADDESDEEDDEEEDAGEVEHARRAAPPVAEEEDGPAEGELEVALAQEGGRPTADLAALARVSPTNFSEIDLPEPEQLSVGESDDPSHSLAQGDVTHSDDDEPELICRLLDVAGMAEATLTGPRLWSRCGGNLPTRPGAVAGADSSFAFDDTARILEREAQATDDKIKRGHLLAEASRAYLRAGSQEAAERAIRQAMEAAEDDVVVLWSASSLFRRNGSVKDEVSALESLALVDNEPSRRGAALVRLALLHLEEASESAGAVGALREVLAQAPVHPVAAPLLRELLAHREQWTELASLVSSEVWTAHADLDYARFQECCARLLGGEEAEITSRLMARVGEPDLNLLDLTLLWRLLSGEGGAAALLKVARARAEVSEGTQAARWWEVVAAQAAGCQDSEAEIHALRQVVAADPGSVPAVWRLEAALAREQRWPELVESLKVEVGSDDELITRAERRAQILDVCLKDVQGAEAALEEATRLAPHAVKALDHHIHLLRRACDWERLLAAFVQRARASSDPREQAAAWFEAGRVAEQHLSDDSRAWEHYRRAWQTFDHSVYLWTAVRVAEDRRDWEGMVDLLMRSASVSLGAGTVTAGDLAALILDLQLGRTEDAVPLYERSLRDGGGSPLSMLGLLRGMRREGRIGELLNLLRGSARDVIPGLRQWLMVEEARLHEERLGDVAAAIAVFEQVMEEEMDFLPARWAVERLRPSAQADTQRRLRESWPEMETTGGWQELLELARSERSSPELARAAEIHALAALRDVPGLTAALGEYDEGCWPRVTLLMAQGSCEAACQALSLMPGDLDEPAAMFLLCLEGVGHQLLAARAGTMPRVWHGLAALSVVSSNAAHRSYWWSQAARSGVSRRTATEAGLAVLGTLQDQRELALACEELAHHAELGSGWWWLAGHLWMSQRVQDRGAGAWNEAATDVRLAPLVIRDFLQVVHDDPQLTCELLGRLLEEVRSPEDQLSLQMELASWHELAGDREAALVIYTQLVGEHPRYSPPLLGQARLLSELGRWSEYARVLREHQDITPSAEVREMLGERLEQILAERLDDPVAVETRLRKRLEFDVDELSLERLGSLLKGQARWPELAELIVWQLDPVRAPQEERQADLLLELGRIQELHLGDTAAAVESYQRTLECRPSDEAALAAVRRLCEEREDWEGLAGALAREASIRPRDERHTLYRQIARLWEEKLEDYPSAAISWAKVLELVNDDPEALGALVGLYRRLEDWSSMVDVGASLYLQTRDVTLARELGEVLAEKLQRFDDAQHYLLEGAAAGAVSVRGLMEVSSFLERATRWAEAVNIYRLITQQGQPEGAVLHSYHRLEFLARGPVLDRALMLEAQEAIGRLQPNNVENLYRLVESLDLAGRTDEAIQRCGQLLALPSAPATLGPERMGQLERRRVNWLEAAGQYEAAWAAMDTLIKNTPEDQVLLEEGQALLRRTQQWERCAELQEQILTLRGGQLSRDEQLRLLRELAGLRRMAGQRDKALEALGRAREIVPNDVTLYLEMAEIHAEREEWYVLLGVYNQVIRYSTDPSQVVQAYVDKADILDTKLGPQDVSYLPRAVMHYEKALQFDRRNTYCMLRLVEIHLRQSEYDKARDWLKQLLASGPSVAFQTRALILSAILQVMYKKDVPAALVELRRAVAISPGAAAQIEPLQADIETPSVELPQLLGSYLLVVKALSTSRL